MFLRDGKIVAHHELSSENVTEDLLFREIVGRVSYYELYSKYQYGVAEAKEKPIVLSVRQMTKKGFFQDVSFDLHEGECIGLFGPAGCGKSEVAKALFGIIHADSEKIYVGGIEIKPKSDPYERMRRGIGYFSGDTGKELFLHWPIRKNLSIVNFEKITRRLLKIVSIINFNIEKELD
jgi:ABC-type sugar transport system, ATPase component